jgi:hypothetical protein
MRELANKMSQNSKQIKKQSKMKKGDISEYEVRKKLQTRRVVVASKNMK